MTCSVFKCLLPTFLSGCLDLPKHAVRSWGEGILQVLYLPVVNCQQFFQIQATHTHQSGHELGLTFKSHPLLSLSSSQSFLSLANLFQNGSCFTFTYRQNKFGPFYPPVYPHQLTDVKYHCKIHNYTIMYRYGSKNSFHEYVSYIWYDSPPQQLFMY